MEPSKTVLLGDRPFTLHGISGDDRYFSALRDNMEDQLAGICRATLPAKAGIWDIGANIGVTALTMAALSPDWQIVAVEGGPEVHQTLQRNVLENVCEKQIRTVHAAVGETDGQASFYEHSAFGHIAGRSEETATALSVRQVSACTLFSEYGPPTLDFAKVDIEGGEFSFLRGGMDLFKQHRSILCMEFNMWTLMWCAHIVPTDFLDWIVQNFADVRLLQHQGIETQRITSDPRTLHDTGYHIMTRMDAICNLLICSEEGRIGLP